jgi:Uma2 family endonuclease
MEPQPYTILSPERPRPLWRREYDRLVALGCFEDERVELLRGVIVSMSPQGPRHAGVIETLTLILVRLVSPAASVRVQCPLALAEDSEPDPDLAVVAPGDRRSGHPDTAYLVIEVAETSLRKDRELKAGLYAGAGIPEYWIVNLVDDVVEVRSTPRGGDYSELRTYPPGAQIPLTALASLTSVSSLPVREILGQDD